MVASTRLVRAMKEAAERIDGHFYADYRGRMMFGEKCIAISGPSDFVIAASVVEEALKRGVASEALRWIRRCSRDDMGKGAIIYAPSCNALERT
jgi:hypothetical protein